MLDVPSPDGGAIGVRKVDVTRGSVDGSVSSQWYSRPDDQRFLDLGTLRDFLSDRKERSRVDNVETRRIQVRADVDDPRALALQLPDGRQVVPNHWTFSQLCSRIGAPAGFIRDRLHYTAGPVIQECLNRSDNELVKVMETMGAPEDWELRAMTGPDYGRVWDAEIVDAVLRVADDGTWKVPGQIDWSRGVYDPDRPVTKRTTTLYASDRDVFVFLCRDQYPIEVGKLADGSPDLIFPGFMVSNSEVGSRAFTLDTLYLRGICENRNLWGVENRTTLRLRHSKGLPARFLGEAMPKLEEFSTISASAVARKVTEAKRISVGDDDDEVMEFLGKRDFSQKAAKSVMDSVYGEEGHKARSLWDLVNGITAVARDIPHQDARVDMERKAAKLMDAVKV